MRRESCLGCHYWLPPNYPQSLAAPVPPPEGECRRRSPRENRFSSASGDFREVPYVLGATWPITKPPDFCGDFKPREV